MKRCMFCGELLVDGVCPNMAQHFKPMCYNCQYVSTTDDDCLCLNEENKKDAADKIIQSYEGGYKITNIELSPIPLKDPSKKCKRHELNIDTIVQQLTNKKEA